MTQEVTMAVVAHADDEVMFGHELHRAAYAIAAVSSDGENTTLDYEQRRHCPDRY